jgi:hypothetical protein
MGSVARGSSGAESNTILVVFMKLIQFLIGMLHEFVQVAELQYLNICFKERQGVLEPIRLGSFVAGDC